VIAFQTVFDWLERELGIDASRGGLADAIVRFVTERCRQLRLSMTSYVALLARDALEADRLAGAASVPHTWFLRDREQLEDVVEHLARQGPRTTPANVWVAGCATGEEAYSVAMLAHGSGIPLHILATDINKRALATASRGRYGAWSVRALSPAQREVLATPDGLFQVPEFLRALVSFEAHNLALVPPRIAGGWDAIVCRNVLIYFTRRKAEETVRRLRASLAKHGRLLLGVSDVLANAPPDEPPPPPLPIASPASPAPRLEAAPDLERPVATNTTLLELAHAALDRGDVDAACTTFKAALAEDPLSAEAYLFHGIASSSAGNGFAAMASLRSARLLEPTLWPADFYLGLAYESIGARDDALRSFARMLTLAEATTTGAPAFAALLARFEQGRAHMLKTARSRLGKGNSASHQHRARRAR
jgi:chemotaxis methyl-accepting protein methylase